MNIKPTKLSTGQKLPGQVITGTAMILFAAFCGTLAICEELSDEVKDVLVKLETFEKAELAKAELAIQKKRGEVINYLQKTLQVETKAGNLDRALAIKTQIDQLREEQGFPPVVAESSKDTPGVRDEMAFSDWLQTVVFVNQEKGSRYWLEGDVFMIDFDVSESGVNKGIMGEIEERRRRFKFMRGPGDKGLQIRVEHNLEEAQLLWPNGALNCYLEVISRE